ncbi:MAG: glycerophosphodiester phosphodiesterase [Alphaproteobacteria bacterium]
MWPPPPSTSGSDASATSAEGDQSADAGTLRGPCLPRVIGHRGSASTAPENTIASFRAAAALGVAMVEFDVKLSADGRTVIIHDETLERTTDGHGRVRETTLEDLRRLDAGGWFEPRFAGERLPTLEETLDFLVTVELRANIELKPCPGLEERTAHVAMASAAERWPGGRVPPLVSSFSRVALAAAREVAPTWPRGLIVDRLPDDWREATAALGVSTLHCQERHLSPVAVAEVRRTGLVVVAWTVNTPERARTLWGWGVDAVITDTPDVILDAVP